MIDPGDLSLPARVTVVDGYTRPWRRCFRKTPKLRTVFMGFIRNVHYDSRGTTFELEDAFSRLERSPLR